MRDLFFVPTITGAWLAPAAKQIDKGLILKANARHD